jgi:hypothetical protein
MDNHSKCPFFDKFKTLQNGVQWTIISVPFSKRVTIGRTVSRDTNWTYECTFFQISHRGNRNFVFHHSGKNAPQETTLSSHLKKHPPHRESNSCDVRIIAKVTNLAPVSALHRRTPHMPDNSIFGEYMSDKTTWSNSNIWILQFLDSGLSRLELQWKQSCFASPSCEDKKVALKLFIYLITKYCDKLLSRFYFRAVWGIGEDGDFQKNYGSLHYFFRKLF